MKRIKEDMVAGTYNPGKELSFGDLIVQELEKRRASGSLSPVLHSYAVDLTRKIHNQLYHIYGRSRHGLQQAVMAVLSLTHKRLS